MNNKKLCRNHRPPLRKIDTDSTVPPPLISRGSTDCLVLEYLNSLKKGQVSNFRRLAINLKKARSTLLSARDRLLQKKLITKEFTGSYIINYLGKKALTMSTGYVETSRVECRGKGLSLHHIKFVSKIIDRNFFSESLMNDKNITFEKAGMKNWNYYIIRINENRVLIKPKEVVIEIKELVGNNAEEQQTKSLFQAFEIMEFIKSSLTLKIETLTLEPEHFERMDSELSKLFYKKLGKYEITLDNGSKFWVDCSKDQMNDETDDIDLRNKLDDFLNDLPKSECLMSDVDKLKIDVENANKIIEGLLKLSMIEKGILKPKKNKIENSIIDKNIYYAN